MAYYDSEDGCGNDLDARGVMIVSSSRTIYLVLLSKRTTWENDERFEGHDTLIEKIGWQGKSSRKAFMLSQRRGTHDRPLRGRQGGPSSWWRS